MMIGFAESKDPRLISREISFESKYVVTIGYLNVTDGRMDGQTNCHENTAL